MRLKLYSGACVRRRDLLQTWTQVYPAAWSSDLLLLSTAAWQHHLIPESVYFQSCSLLPCAGKSNDTTFSCSRVCRTNQGNHLPFWKDLGRSGDIFNLAVWNKYIQGVGHNVYLVCSVHLQRWEHTSCKERILMMIWSMLDHTSIKFFLNYFIVFLVILCALEWWIYLQWVCDKRFWMLD